ncbi:MAG: sugar phosphate isomerase/epimerase [Ignisphaera sp.]
MWFTIAFSTMVLLNLDPFEATAKLIESGFHVEVCYDNFLVFGGRYVEDVLFKKFLDSIQSIRKTYIKSVHMPYDELDADTIPFEHILNRMVKWLRFAHEIGASIAVFHTLKTSSDPLNTNLHFFREIAREAMDRGIRIAVENRLEKNLFGSKPEDLKNIVESVGEGIGICLDVGHANINKNLDAFLKTLENSIIELHLHDNNGFRDEHKPPFTGSVDWNAVIGLIKRKRDILPVFEIACREPVVSCLSIANRVKQEFEM